jgi:hypothetical protein
MAHGAGSAFLLPPCATGSRAIALQRDQLECCWIVIQGSSRRPYEANGPSISQPDGATMGGLSKLQEAFGLSAYLFSLIHIRLVLA